MAVELTYGQITTSVEASGAFDEVNERYAPALKALLPTGSLWNFEQDSEAYALLRALSYSLSRIEIRGQDLLREFHPATMRELLPDWERVLGLPGDNPSPPTTLAARREAVLARLLGFGDPTPAFYETIAESLGYVSPEVISVPFAPFVAGSVAGADLANNDGGGWAFVWYLNVVSNGDDATLEWLLAQLVPEHTKLLISYVPVLTEQENPSNRPLYGVCYGNDLWVAVGQSGGDAYIVTSADGVTWTERSNPQNVTLRDVAWNGSLFVAVGETNGTTSYILTSSDGITWTERVGIAGKTNWLYGVCWGSGQWVAVGDADADSFVITSPDGVTWTEQSTPTATNLFGVAYDGSDLFVAVGDATGGGGGACLITSSDGVTWTQRSNPRNVELNSVAHDYDQTWVAVGGNVGGDAYLITSANGITWSETVTSKDLDLNAVAYDWMTRLWIAVGDSDGTDAYVLVSRDAVTWEEIVNPQDLDLYGVASGGLNKWVAVGENDGTDGYLVSFIKE